MKTFLKIIGGIIVVVLVLAAIGFYFVSSDSSNDPQLEVISKESPPGLFMGMLISITSKNDDPVAITRVVINNRQGEVGCDFSREMNRKNVAYYSRDPALEHFGVYEIPIGGITLKTGDQTQEVISSACGTTVKAEIFTDKGIETYTFSDSQ